MHLILQPGQTLKVDVASLIQITALDDVHELPGTTHIPSTPAPETNPVPVPTTVTTTPVGVTVGGTPVVPTT
jgi:hypothetical protein